MALPKFTVTGNIFDIVGDTNGGELEEKRYGDGLWTRARVVFTPNIPRGQVVRYDGNVYHLKPVEAEIMPDGSLAYKGGTVTLVANDDGLDVDDLQYKVEIAGLAPFWFDAPEDGQTVDLYDLVPAAHRDIFRGIDVELDGDELVFKVGGGEVGRASLDTWVGEALDATVPGAVNADLAARNIGWVDDGDGSGHFTVGGVPISGVHVPPAATWSGVAGKPVLDVREYGDVDPEGVEDSTEAIQDALDAAKAMGGATVIVPPGTYLIDDTYLLMDGNNVTLQGAGRNVTILKSTANHSILRASGASGICIRDLQVLGTGNPSDNSQIGIDLRNVTDSLIHNVYAKNTGYDGICLLVGCVGNTVSDCRVEGCGDDGINLGGQNTADTLNNVVTGNVISGVTNVGIHISDRSQYSTVVGNTIYDCLVGINTYNSESYFGGGSNIISGNNIRNCSLFGIQINDSDDNIVSGNRIDGSQRGFRVHNSSRTQFTGNTVTNPTGFAYLDESDCDDLTIANNVFVGATANVRISSPRAQFRGNRVKGIASGAAVQCVSTGTDAVIADNTVSDCAEVGIELNSAPRCVVSGNRLIGGTTPISVTSGATDCVVSHNVVSEGTRGIVITGADCLVSNNMLYAQTEFGIYAAASARAQLIGNHLRSQGRAINIFGATDTFVAHNVTVSTSIRPLSEDATSSNTWVADNKFDNTSVFISGTNSFYRPIGADLINYGPEYASNADYQRSVWKQAKATLSAVSGASVTATNLIPAGAFLLGVTTRINTDLGDTNGTTGYTVGDGTDPDLWGSLTATAAGSATGSADYTDAAAAKLYTSAQSVVITAAGGDFDGTGEIEVVAHYMICEAT